MDIDGARVKMKFILILVLLLAGCAKPQPPEDDLPFDVNNWRYEWPVPQQREWMRQYKIKQTSNQIGGYRKLLEKPDTLTDLPPYFSRAIARSSIMKTIPLTQGKFAIVDDADYECLAQHKWYAKKQRNIYYAVRMSSRTNSKRHTIRMHQVILKPSPGTEIDHKDGNGLNNCRSNLRRATCSENHANARKRRSASSRFKGVYWHKAARKWHAKIRVNYKKIRLGYFDNEEEAARAYDEAARKYFGEFALANF